MKLNNKGYMLAEVVVASSLIAVVLVTLFIGLNRASSSYEKRNRYHDIDAMYASMEMNDVVKREADVKNIITNNQNCISFNDIREYHHISISILDVYQQLYGAKPISYFVDCNNIGDITTYEEINQTFKDYIEYLESSFDKSNCNYVVVTELCKKTDDCYYYALKVGSDG